MTVGELMEALAAAPRDAEAIVECPFDGGYDGTIGILSLVTYRHHGRALVLLEAEEEGSRALWEEAYPERAQPRLLRGRPRRCGSAVAPGRRPGEDGMKCWRGCWTMAVGHAGERRMA